MNQTLDPKIQKCIGNIEDRLLGVQNDLKAFVYVRQNNLQHSTKDNIGGGSIVVALSLFTALNFLGKTYYCIARPDKFNEDGSAKNETATFVNFMKFIQRDIDLGLSTNGQVLELVWSGFRDHLAHRLTVEPGKSIITFQFEPSHEGSISDILERVKGRQVFGHDGNHRNWIVNGDVLLAVLPDIIAKTIEFIASSDADNVDLLLKVIGVEYP
ncbi:MAG TPA: hypothetical protein VM581_02385 [Magnetospirillaceae bacterium]|nr:hypothetical protein [Magnetospirillaceae bacterium]